jgi:hypothetical protein
MKKILITSFLFILSICAFSQQFDSVKIFHAYTIKTDISTRIKSTSLLSFQLNFDTLQGNITEKYITGYIQNISNSTVTIIPTFENTVTVYDQKTKNVDVEYDYPFDTLLQVNKNNINYITRERNYEPFAIIPGLSACAILYAPLISYNFKKHELNEDRLKKITIIGGILTVASIAIIIPLEENPKKFLIK